MSGNNSTGLVLTSRDYLLFQQLVKYRLLDRDQAKAMAGFHSTQRTNSRLLKLVSAGLLKRVFLGTRAGGTKAVYALNRKSAALIKHEGRVVERSQDTLLVGDQFVQHQLLTNEIAIRVQFTSIPIADTVCNRYLTFQTPLSQNISLIPDSYFEIKKTNEIYSMFCEVDRGTESQRVWAKKITLYLKLATSGNFQKLFKQSRFRVLIVAPSERRLEAIRCTVLRQTNKIFWLATLETINREGFWSPIWLRPEGAQRCSLL